MLEGHVTFCQKLFLLCWFTNLASTHRGQGENRKREATPDWRVTGLISKGTYFKRLVLGTAGLINLCTHEDFKSLQSSLQSPFSPDGLDTALLSQGCILENALAMGTRGAKSLLLFWFSSQVNQGSRSLHDLLQHHLKNQALVCSSLQ